VQFEVLNPPDALDFKNWFHNSREIK
jgi:hypothetical protein